MYGSVYGGIKEIVADIPVEEDAPGQVPQEDIFAKSKHNNRIFRKKKLNEVFLFITSRCFRHGRLSPEKRPHCLAIPNIYY